MTTDQQDDQSKSGSGMDPEQVTREGTKEDIRAVDPGQPSTKPNTTDNFREGTKEDIRAVDAGKPSTKPDTTDKLRDGTKS